MFQICFVPDFIWGKSHILRMIVNYHQQGCLHLSWIDHLLQRSQLAIVSWSSQRSINTSLSSEGYSLSHRLLIFVVIAPLAPLFGIGWILERMFITSRFRQILGSSTNPELGPDTMSMSNKLRRVIDDILVILFGINQPRGFLKRTRIVANTYIVLGMRDSTTLPTTHIYRELSPVNQDNMADALTLGQKPAKNSRLLELNYAGKLALLESRILPNYKQLRFLDGRSGIATLIIGVQAIGYVTSIHILEPCTRTRNVR